MNFLLDVIATFGAVFAYYDSPIFSRIREYLSFTKLQTILMFSIIFTFTTVIGLNAFDYLVAVASSVLIINALNTRLRQIRR